ncbi:MAG TPA: hypothetical protein PKA64_15040, partial [Myxococcota bacterium]|nr:hypothetical protein [Myxococcota bacterium]
LMERALGHHEREIARRVYRALCRYDAPIYPGRLVVLRASARKLRDPFLADNGWGAHARDGVELHTIRAGHELMCAREPFAGRVADALRRSLTRAGG